MSGGIASDRDVGIASVWLPRQSLSLALACFFFVIVIIVGKRKQITRWPHRPQKYRYWQNAGNSFKQSQGCSPYEMMKARQADCSTVATWK